MIGFYRTLRSWELTSQMLKRESFWEAFTWIAFGVFCVLVGWSEILTVTFLISIWANARTAFGAYQAARAEEAAEGSEDAVHDVCRHCGR